MPAAVRYFVAEPNPNQIYVQKDPIDAGGRIDSCLMCQ